ncbi:uncharacterized protein C1orf185 homolog isoform X2 [Erythrolamprus reginae]
MNRIPEQSTLKKDNRNYKNFRINFKIHGQSAIKNHQLRYVVQFKINLNLVRVKKTIQISKEQLVTSSSILMERNYLRRLSMDTNLKDCKVKVNWYINVKKKFEDNKSHASYFENGCKYMETRSPMSYMEQQANILRSELLQKSQKSLGSMSKFTKKHKGENHIETNILKEKCKHRIDRLLTSVKENFCKVITNKYNKNLHRIVSDEQKILNRKRKKYVGFKSLQQEKKLKEKIKIWKWKTSEKSIYANQKFQFRHLFTYERNSHIQKVYSTQKKMFNIQRKKFPIFQIKIYRNKHLIQKRGDIVKARKEFGEREMGTLFKNCYMYFSIINLKFLTITICMKQEFFSSRKYQTQQLIQVKKMLQYFLPSSERVKNKYFSLSQKGFKMSFLKTLIVKQLIKKECFPSLTYQYFYKDIFNSPSSILERTKRSAEDEDESVPVGVLKHLSNALIAGAILFGIALFIIVLAGFYLYFKRREVLKFFNTVLKDGKSSPKSKSTDAKGHDPISVSQKFHFGQPKDSKKKKKARAKDVEAHDKDHVTVKKIYDSSDTEGKSHRSLSVRSRAYVLPSQSSGSEQSFYDDVCEICATQFYLSDEYIVENPYSNLSSTTPKAKETVSVACQTNHWVKDDQNYINPDMSPKPKKPTISRSKSENDIKGFL